MHSKRTSTKTTWTKLDSKHISKYKTGETMLNKHTVWDNIKSDHISSVLEISITINNNLFVNVFLLESIICLINSFHEELSIDLFSLVDETIANLIFHELKRKCCSIESKERWCSSYLSVKNINIIHHICFWVSFHKSNSSSTRESWLGIFHNIFSSNKNPTCLSASKIFMRTEEDKIYLLQYF